MKMEAQDQLRLELMHARTELAFLLSEQVRAQAHEILLARRHVKQLLEEINANRYSASGGSP
jgi:hypothetical protein